MVDDFSSSILVTKYELVKRQISSICFKSYIIFEIDPKTI